METVLNAPYFGYNGVGLLYTAATEQSNSALATQHALELYNLRSRETSETTAKLQERTRYSNAAVAVPQTSNKRERKSQGNRSRTLYNKRLLVNARERERMKTLNKGFENLRNALPCYIADGHISKITTLRLAINYIKSLSAVLQDAASTEGHGSIIEQLPCSVEMNHLTTTAVTTELVSPPSQGEHSYNPQFASVCITNTSEHRVVTSA